MFTVWGSHADGSVLPLTFVSQPPLRAPMECVAAGSPRGLLPCQALGDSEDREASPCPWELEVQCERGGEDRAGACILRKGRA